MKRNTWECVVWDGAAWQRFPDCIFMTPEAALDASTKIPAGAVYVRTTRELDTIGLPDGPPEPMRPRARR